ncbi:hypothetical protein ACF1BP_37605, partial [Streptomyces sp. NPDC014735]
MKLDNTTVADFQRRTVHFTYDKEARGRAEPRGNTLIQVASDRISGEWSRTSSAGTTPSVHPPETRPPEPPGIATSQLNWSPQVTSSPRSQITCRVAEGNLTPRSGSDGALLRRRPLGTVQATCHRTRLGQASWA